MKIGYHRPAAARATSIRLGTGESAVSLTWELSAPRIVAFEHAEQSRERGSSSGPRSDWSEEAHHGTATRAVRGTGRPSGHRGGVCAWAGAGRETRATRADLRDDGGRAPSPARVARRAGR